MSKELRDLYISHHKERGKYGRKTGGKERVQILRGFIGEGKKVLDLGCRDGNLTRFFTEGNEVVGADIDDVALALCEKELGIKTYHVNLNDDFPFEDETFDAVIAGEIVEHVVIPDHFVREIHRVLRKNGVFCGTTPNAFRLKVRLRFLMGNPIDQDPTHLHYFSYDSLERLLSKYFHTVTIIPFHGHIIGSNKLGIPVKPDSSRFVGRLFSRHFLWKAVKD